VPAKNLVGSLTELGAAPLVDAASVIHAYVSPWRRACCHIISILLKRAFLLNLFRLATSVKETSSLLHACNRTEDGAGIPVKNATCSVLVLRRRMVRRLGSSNADDNVHSGMIYTLSQSKILGQ
jgi:hypothetical protein